MQERVFHLIGAGRTPSSRLQLNAISHAIAQSALDDAKILPVNLVLRVSVWHELRDSSSDVDSVVRRVGRYITSTSSQQSVLDLERLFCSSAIKMPFYGTSNIADIEYKPSFREPATMDPRTWVKDLTFYFVFLLITATIGPLLFGFHLVRSKLPTGPFMLKAHTMAG